VGRPSIRVDDKEQLRETRTMKYSEVACFERPLKRHCSSRYQTVSESDIEIAATNNELMKQERRVSSQEWRHETASESDIEQEKSITQGSVEIAAAKNELMKHVRRVKSQRRYQINKGVLKRKRDEKLLKETEHEATQPKEIAKLKVAERKLI
jgi:hypothetical protein